MSSQAMVATQYRPAAPETPCRLPRRNKWRHLQRFILAKQATPGFWSQQQLKRIIDLTIALISLLLLSPVWVGIALLVWATSPGPVLYKSTRIGQGYRPFEMYKFRTMHVDADSLREALRKQANLQGNLFKLPHDPRVTRVGKFLRAFSLDELPQLLNVIRGEMSLVGPRPLPPDESHLFEAPYTMRYFVKPGITGIWQISGRSKLDFKKLCQLELSYILQWNAWQDIKILLKTIPVVLLREGAY